VAKTPKQSDDADRFDPEEAMRRMNQALRGARVAGPKQLKEKPRIGAKRKKR